MRAYFVRVGRSLMPTDEASESVVARMEPGERAEFRIVRPRSSQWNRLYWSICRTVGANQDPPRDEDSIDAELRILAGHFDVMYVKGHEVRVPKRIAFDRMTADEWAALWPSIELAIRTTFGDEYIREQAA